MIGIDQAAIVWASDDPQNSVDGDYAALVIAAPPAEQGALRLNRKGQEPYKI